MGGPAPTSDIGAAGSGLLGDIFGLAAPQPINVVIPKVTWLPAEKGKGLEIQGTFSRRNAQVSMDMTFTNKAMQAMSAFAIQLNKNSFGLVPSAPLQMGALQPSQTVEVSLVLNTTGTVQRMEPLNNLQVCPRDLVSYICLTNGYINAIHIA